MKSKIKQKKGISLIVLVITIIIMIILAAAIILSLNASGVISRANKAKSDSDLSNKKHAATLALSEYSLLVNSNGTSMNDSDATQYVREKLEAQGIDAGNVVVLDGKSMVSSGASAINKGVTIGDYVAYTPTEVTSTIYKVGITNTYFSTQIGDNALRWRYMGVDSSGNALLIADRETTDPFRLYGKDGYVNGSTKLNDLCNELYSSSLGDARSIDENDVNKVLEANPVGQYTSKTGNSVKNPDNLTIGELVSEKGETALTYTYTPDGENTWEAISKYSANYYYYYGTTYKANTTNEYKLIFKNTSDSNIRYWLASPCLFVAFNDSYARFGMRYVASGYVNSDNLFISTDFEGGGDTTKGRPVRPVIVLKSNVQFGAKDGSGVWSIS